MNPFLVFILSLAGFSGTELLLQRTKLQGNYYLIHAIHNALVVSTTLDDVQAAFTTKQDKLLELPSDTTAIALVFALHLYHILFYWKKFRFDDWLHHILMIGVALPVGCMLPAGPLMGMSLFFTTGLPGGLDYLLLFFVRNHWLAPLKEKRVNRWLNVWIRSPGCIAQATLTLATILTQDQSSWLAYIPAVLNYWNGCYFMEQVVADHARRALENSHVL